MKHSKSSAKKKQTENASAASSPKRRSSKSRPPVMGLDLSLTATGLVVWDGRKIKRKRRYKTEPLAPSDGLKLRPRGQLAPDRFRGDDEERIDWLRKKVRATVKKFGICFVVIEGHAFNAKGRGKTVLSELAGVIKNELHRLEVAFVIVTPPALKKSFTGNGKASKVDMVMTAKEYDRSISDSDTADALAAAVFGDKNYENLVDE